MRRGIFGGTFNPVHHGHLCLAEEAWFHAGLDELTFIPNNRPPHKDNPEVTAEVRYQMLLAATEGVDHFSVSRVELEREGPSYTYDTLMTFEPSEELVFVCGADAFNAPWHKLSEVVDRLDQVLIAHRAGYPVEVPAQLQALSSEQQKKISLMPFPEIAISSSLIRNRRATGRAHRFLIPGPVYRIITKSDLYSVKN